MANSLSKTLRWILVHKRYKNQWVNDLPESPEKKTIYIVGGREYPFRVVMGCPNVDCKHLVYLDIDPKANPKWTLIEGKNSKISLSPSVFLTGLPCRSHYWVKNNKVQWAYPTWVDNIRRGRLKSRAKYKTKNRASYSRNSTRT